MKGACVWAFVLSVAACTECLAQTSLPGRLEVGGGVGWLGSASAGDVDATETTGTGGQSTIFKTSTTLAASAALRLNAGYKLSEAFEAEGLVSFGKPRLKTSVTNDIENASPITAEETLSEYMFGGGLLWYLPIKDVHSRARIFVAGHAAYVRQLHEANTLAVTGQEYEFAGGLKFFFPGHAASHLKGFGIRGDAGLAIRTHGLFFDDRARYSPAVTGGVFVRF
jgi:hypothetical protein